LFQIDLPAILCDIVNWSDLAFDCYLGQIKQLQVVVSPLSIYAIINRRTNEMIEGVNQHFSFLFFASLYVLLD